MLYDASEQGLESLHLTYCYFLLKVVDLLDTVFIVLKKNNSQLSSLHCYHHFLMASSMYFGLLTIPGGPPTIMALLNCFVHSCMYSYYFLTTLYPHMKTSVWKKRLTQIQLASLKLFCLPQVLNLDNFFLQIQFGLIFIHFLHVILTPNCNFPKLWIWFLFSQDWVMLFMFGNFYRRTYRKKTE